MLFKWSFFNQFRHIFFPSLHIWSSGSTAFSFPVCYFCLLSSWFVSLWILQPWMVRERLCLRSGRHPAGPGLRYVPLQRFMFASARWLRILPTGDGNVDFSTCSNIDSQTSVTRPVVTYSLGSPLSTPNPTKHTHTHWSGWEIGTLFVCLASFCDGKFYIYIVFSFITGVSP